MTAPSEITPGLLRTSDCELIAIRLIGAPISVVFEAWRKPEIFREWWVPKTVPLTLVSCDMDVRTGGTYRLVFTMDGQSAEFFGQYLEVIPSSRLVWTNDEGGESNRNITTVTFESVNDSTKVLVSDLYPSRQALDTAITTGAIGSMPEQLAQLEQLLIEQRNP